MHRTLNIFWANSLASLVSLSFFLLKLASAVHVHRHTWLMSSYSFYVPSTHYRAWQGHLETVFPPLDQEAFSAYMKYYSKHGGHANFIFGQNLQNTNIQMRTLRQRDIT